MLLSRIAGESRVVSLPTVHGEVEDANGEIRFHRRRKSDPEDLFFEPVDRLFKFWSNSVSIAIFHSNDAANWVQDYCVQFLEG